MSNNQFLFAKFLFLLSLILVSSTLKAEETKYYRGKALIDCSCETYDDTGTTGSIKIKAKEAIDDGFCDPIADKDRIRCESRNWSFSGVYCPSKCVELLEVKKPTKEEFSKEIDKVKPEFLKKYKELIPGEILTNIAKQYPQWLPFIENIEMIDKFKLQLGDFYLNTKKYNDPKVGDITILYIFENLDNLIEKKLRRTFWETSTAKLLYSDIDPDPVSDLHFTYGRILCPFGGPNVDEVVLTGFYGGPMDASGCCGPYSLMNIRSGSLVLRDSSTPSAEYYSCRGDAEIYLIDGPANIRDSEWRSKASIKNNKLIEVDWRKTPILGKCNNNSRVVITGWYDREEKWAAVFCEGLEGATHRNNIRWDKKVKL
jgi:hypothetical protein